MEVKGEDGEAGETKELQEPARVAGGRLDASWLEIGRSFWGLGAYIGFGDDVHHVVPSLILASLRSPVAS